MKAPNILRHILTQPFESLRDLFTALIEPTAMTPHQRHLDEFKLLAGGALS
jgi:hypothetical protein